MSAHVAVVVLLVAHHLPPLLHLLLTDHLFLALLALHLLVFHFALLLHHPLLLLLFELSTLTLLILGLFGTLLLISSTPLLFGLLLLSLCLSHGLFLGLGSFLLSSSVVTFVLRTTATEQLLHVRCRIDARGGCLELHLKEQVRLLGLLSS